MKKVEFNQAVSLTIFISDNVRKDGRSTLYLRIIISRKKREINLNEAWPVRFFDRERECVLPRHANDKDVSRVNAVISEAKGRANKIKLRYFVDSKLLTLDLFEKEFVNYASADNFMAYWKRKQAELVAQSIISEESGRNHTTNYKRLNEFIGGGEYLSFADINLQFVQRFNSWLHKTKKLKHNSAGAAHSNLRAYLNRALEDDYKFTNPYVKFSFSYRAGEREVLTEDELQRLKDLYRENDLDITGQEVLRKFLFSCYTGLRISDSGRVTRDMIVEGKLHINLKKGENFGKSVHILLPDFALKLTEGRVGLLFQPLADATCNKYLKIIAILAKIKKRLTFHVSRDVFGTHFIMMGGDVYTLMLLMGHTDIRTTMIYVKLAEQRGDMQMKNFDKRDQGKI